MKKCKKCNEVKPLSDFCKTQSTTGRGINCKICDNDKQRAAYDRRKNESLTQLSTQKWGLA